MHGNGQLYEDGVIRLASVIQGHPGTNTDTISLSPSCSPISFPGKKKMEGMCEACNHGYPLALCLVTREEV